MKRFLLALVCVLLGSADGVAQSSLEKLSWLEGDWVRQTKRGQATERWHRVSANTMEGVVFVASGDSIHISEHMRIERFGDEIFYLAKPEENPFPTFFKVVLCDDDRVVFENPDHDFPQRIIYTRIDGHGLTVRIEGLMDGKLRGRDFSFERGP